MAVGVKEPLEVLAAGSVPPTLAELNFKALVNS